MDDYYETLQVSRRADPEVIKVAYHRLALKYHPDRNPGDASVEKVMKRLNEAWYVLSDPSARSAYDRKGEGETIHQAERERETAAEEERQHKQARRPDINAPRTGNNSDIRKLDWPPVWVVS